MANVRISGLDDSVTPEEIRLALAEKTGVSPEDFKVGLITHGPIGKVLQGNLNHAVAAQDLLCQTVAEWNINVAVIAEPYSIPRTHKWAGSVDGSAAIFFPGVACTHSVVERGAGFVAARWGEVVVVSTYFSPNRSRADFESFLATVEGVILRVAPSPVLVAGDLNAWSRAWGSIRTNARGRVLESWVLSLGLQILNRGTTPTCVRWQGTSIVDVTFATPSLAARIRDWRVMAEAVTLSDHRYVRYEVSPTSPGTPFQLGTRPPFPRWSLVRLQPDVAEEAAMVRAWAEVPDTIAGDADSMADLFADDIKVVCNAAMPKTQACPRNRGKVYWWTQELSSLRTASMGARRAYQRCRRRARGTPVVEEALYRAYQDANKALRTAIRKAKEDAWDQFLGILNNDPWGRPYRAIRGKLSTAASLTSCMEPGLLRRVLGTLFPDPGPFAPPYMATAALAQGERVDGPPVSDVEFNTIRSRLRHKRKAPGPDGAPSKVMDIALGPLEDRFRAVLDTCMAAARFPRRWRVGRLCLIRKESRPADAPEGYRPVVLLDEAGKAFEKILASRIIQHLEGRGPDLAECQYGFRTGRSTIDAVTRLKRWTEAAFNRGRW
ncbi:reverse transcrpitase [Danaus plexippus plexippus]|uniref:Reverse transcrpitase n=1 Tax=Danaus plexippus plexippus TaxID=278856 RepID=A0A212FI97_DANPL|nr:reverse transcrpitase [Danaus plexippus plexippus]